MRSKVLQRILDKTPKDVEIFVDKYADLVLRINQILREKGYTQKSLAERLDKRPSEIHKWLHGEHNFTLRSIAKLEAELGETLLEVPVKKNPRAFESHNEKTKYALNVHLNSKPNKENLSNWKKARTTEPLSNVG